jgi:hypothetical protein
MHIDPVIRYGFLTLLLNVGFREIYKDDMVVREGSIIPVGDQKKNEDD